MASKTVAEQVIHMKLSQLIREIQDNWGVVIEAVEINWKTNKQLGEDPTYELIGTRITTHRQA